MMFVRTSDGMTYQIMIFVWPRPKVATLDLN